MKNKLLVWSWCFNKFALILLCWISAYTFFAVIPNYSINLSEYYSARGSALSYLTISYLLLCVVTLVVNLIGKVTDRCFFILDIIGVFIFTTIFTLLAGNYGF